MAINRGLTASPEDGGSAYYLDSSFLSSRPRRHTSLDSTKRPARPYRARSASNILDSTDDFNRRLYDPLLAPHLQRRTTGKDGVSDLVDFLKHQQPPSDNFMSIPDDGEDDERGRWLKWVKMAKRSKSAPRGPPQIRLPDTAVSGTTIGGHRHIAITIPLEALPTCERPRSQYPVYSQQEHKANGHSPSPVRTVVNDKGVVTVLKTVNEDREASSSSSRGNPSHSYTQSGSVPRTPSRGGRTSIQGYFTTPPSRESSVYQSEDGTGRETPKARQSSQAASSAFPKRMSSMANRSLHQHISIDGMLSQPGSAGMRPSGSRDGRQNQADDMEATTIKDEWPLKEKKSVKVKPSPIAINGSSTKEDENTSKESGATVLKESLLGQRQDDPGPPTPVSAQNRRDRVRDRKLRDIEALRNKRQHDDKDETDFTKSQPSFSPIRVVMNVEPDLTMPAEAPLTPSQTESERTSEAKGESAAGAPSAVKGMAEPTPPLSPRNSPPKKQSTLDRTSLSRRREWKATREQERKTKDARAAVRARAKELAAGVPEELRDNPQTLDKEILRLYEAYREHRFRDMERRVRRLERNGDVWLRALVPVLDNLNRTMASSSQEGLNERAYMSDDEPASASRQDTKRTSVPIRRANSSHRAPRDEEATQTPDILEEMEEQCRCGSAGSDEVTGLDTIEPLMRELAGAARLRQMRSRGLLEAY